MDESQKQIAKQLIADGWESIKNNDAKKVQLANLYLSVHRQQPCCLDVLESFYKDLPSQLITKKNTPMKNSDKKFLLKEGSVIYVPSQHAHHTRESLTDEQAIVMLNDNPGCIKHFEKFPENWKSLKPAAIKKAETKPAVMPSAKAAVPEPAAPKTEELQSAAASGSESTAGASGSEPPASEPAAAVETASTASTAAPVKSKRKPKAKAKPKAKK